MDSTLTSLTRKVVLWEFSQSLLIFSTVSMLQECRGVVSIPRTASEEAAHLQRQAAYCQRGTVNSVLMQSTSYI